MFKFVIKSVITLLSGLFFGALGLFLGTYIGGNFSQDFALFGVRGYEAVGQLGFVLGCITGIAVSILFLRNRSQTQSSSDKE